MLRKKTPKRKPNPADSLLKTSKKKDIVLTETELGRASGGLKPHNPVPRPPIKHGSNT
jgi:hypothetical protein